MPKLWSETIETHRREVRDAILDTTAALVGEHGLRSVTMSRIAEQTGIGRATLYKYFSSVDAILLTWHERQITRHLEHLAEVRDRDGTARERLEAVLTGYALIVHGRRLHGDPDLAALLHRDARVRSAEEQLLLMVRDLVAAAVETDEIRDDVAPDELASFCLHAVGAAGTLRSRAAVERLVGVVLDGLRPPRRLDG